MKKILSLILALAMVLAMSVPAFAEGHSTTVTYEGESDAAGTKYTLTVPETLAPGASGTVTLKGALKEGKQLVVSADESVTLTDSNPLRAEDSYDLDVTFAGIEVTGNADDTFEDASETVSVDDFETAPLFGTWTGTFNYTVEVKDAPESSDSGLAAMLVEGTEWTVTIQDDFHVYDITYRTLANGFECTDVAYRGEKN